MEKCMPHSTILSQAIRWALVSDPIARGIPISTQRSPPLVKVLGRPPALIGMVESGSSLGLNPSLLILKICPQILGHSSGCFIGIPLMDYDTNELRHHQPGRMIRTIIQGIMHLLVDSLVQPTNLSNPPSNSPTSSTHLSRTVSAGRSSCTTAV